MITLQIAAGDTANKIIDSAQIAANSLSNAPKELHFIDLLFAGGWVMIPLAILAFLGLVIFIAVSYTHLDVYKRQIQDDSKAKIFLANPLTAGSSSYPSIPDTSIEKIVNIKGFVDLGVGADYKLNQKFSVFAKANNLLSTNYSK